MAFGFLKKLVEVVTGRKSAAKKGGTDAAAQTAAEAAPEDSVQ